MPLWPPHQKTAACVGCPQAARGRGFVPGDGPLPADLMVVVDQPGENDVLEGVAVTGKPGWILQDGLGGKEGRARTYVTNLRKCLAPKGQPPAERAAAIAHCATAYLQWELDDCQPKIVLAIGADSSHVLAGRGDVSVVSGSVYTRAEVDAMRTLGGPATCDPEEDGDGGEEVVPESGA